MLIVPPYLYSGDVIGITCPAGAVNMEDMKFMLHQIEEWGFKIRLGKTVGTSFNKFSATDEERLKDLQQLLDDEEVKAILFGRGGYGVVRILDKIDFTKFVKHPKWLLGYSDITCFHNHIHTNYQIATIHAHMSGGYKPDEYDAASTNSIYDVLVGKPIQYKVKSHTMNRLGEAKGPLVGGNLALLSDLTGTNSDIHTDGKILFIEDIAEYKYNIDRMMWQLAKAGKLKNLAALVVGAFTQTQDNDTPFGMTEYEIVWEKVQEYNYPLVFDFPVGHQPRNVALKLGVQYQLSVQEQGVILSEQSST